MELAYKLGSALVLTVIIVANLWERNNPRTAFSRILWNRFPGLMYVGMAFLAILVVFSTIDAAAMMGLVAPGAADAALPVLGVPMLVLSVAILVLAGRAIYQFKTHR